MDEMANHATRVRRYTSRYGIDRVERFIDTCLCLDNLIDPHSVFMQRRMTRASAKRERDAALAANSREDSATRYPAKSYMDPYINPRRAMEAERRGVAEEAEKARFKHPGPTAARRPAVPAGERAPGGLGGGHPLDHSARRRTTSPRRARPRS